MNRRLAEEKRLLVQQSDMQRLLLLLEIKRINKPKHRLDTALGVVDVVLTLKKLLFPSNR